jgi:hypothetical protein
MMSLETIQWAYKDLKTLLQASVDGFLLVELLLFHDTCRTKLHTGQRLYFLPRPVTLDAKRAAKCRYGSDRFDWHLTKYSCYLS